MKQFLFSALGAFVGVFLFVLLSLFMLGALIAAAVNAAGDNSAAEHSVAGDSLVLELDLREPMLDQPSGAPFAFGETPSLTTTIEALARAETDEKVKGVFIRANEFGMPPAQAEEIRNAILGLRGAGKFVITHSQGFNSTSVLPYLAVSASDELWLQDTAGFSATGLASETPFFGGALEKYNAQSQIFKIAEYKTAANSYNESGYTDAHRESLTAMLQSIYDSSLTQIAQDRDLTPQQARAILDAAPYSTEAVVSTKLVDRMGQVSEARNAALERAGGGDLVALTDYAEARGSAWKKGPVIAMISGQGAVVTGETLDYTGPFGGGDYMGSDTIALAIDEAAKDESVKAIVYRVDSPGGSIVASDQIWDAVERAQEAGKPVVISMGTLAASGGYYVSAGADHIVANPTTLTGSIGIFGGKIVVDGTLEMVGLNVEPLAVGGDFSGAYTAQRVFTESQEAAVRAYLQDGYDEFTTRVAEGREIPLPQVLEIAKGRVWTGQQAMERGLVDELGGLRTAIDAAKRLAEIEPDASVTLKHFPRPLKGFEALQAFFGVSSEAAQAMITLNNVSQLPEVQAALQARQASERRGEIQARSELPDVR